MQPLQYAAGVVGPTLEAAAGLGRWFVGVAVLPVCGDSQRKRQHSATTVHRALPVDECCLFFLQIFKKGLGAAAELGRWLMDVVVLPVVYGYFQRRRQHSATTAHKASAVCEWPGLGMPCRTLRSNTTSTVCSRCDRAFTWG